MGSNTRRKAKPFARHRSTTPLTALCLFAFPLVACSVGPSDPLTATSLAPPPLDASYRDARTNQSLGASPEGALDEGANGVPAGTLLARSGDGRTCVFANGRDGWNRAAC